MDNATLPITHKGISEIVKPFWGFFPTIGALGFLVCGVPTACNPILISFYGQAKRRKRSFFLACLAVVELFKIFTGLWMFFANALAGRRLFGDWGCQYFGFTMSWTSLMTIMVFAAIAFEKCLAINRPFYLGSPVGLRHKLAIAIGLYAGCIMVAALPMLGWGHYRPLGFELSCVFDFVSQSSNDRSYTTLVMMVGFVAPLTVILISYAKILTVFRQNNLNLRDRYKLKLAGSSPCSVFEVAPHINPFLTRLQCSLNPEGEIVSSSHDEESTGVTSAIPTLNRPKLAVPWSLETSAVVHHTACSGKIASPHHATTMGTGGPFLNLIQTRSSRSFEKRPRPGGFRVSTTGRQQEPLPDSRTERTATVFSSDDGTVDEENSPSLPSWTRLSQRQAAQEGRLAVSAMFAIVAFLVAWLPLTLLALLGLAGRPDLIRCRPYLVTGCDTLAKCSVLWNPLVLVWRDTRLLAYSRQVLRCPLTRSCCRWGRRPSHCGSYYYHGRSQNRRNGGGLGRYASRSIINTSSVSTTSLNAHGARLIFPYNTVD